MIEQGCKRIAVVAGPPSLPISEKTLQGYKKVLKKHYQPFREKLIAHTNFPRQSIVEVLYHWLKQKEKPDAIFSISDKCVIYTMQYLKEKKICIPAAICVAGFGNDYMGEIIEPELTSFNVHTHEIGETAARLFLDRINSKEASGPVANMIKGDLITWGSTVRK